MDVWCFGRLPGDSYLAFMLYATFCFHFLTLFLLHTLGSEGVVSVSKWTFSPNSRLLLRGLLGEHARSTRPTRALGW